MKCTCCKREPAELRQIPDFQEQVLCIECYDVVWARRFMETRKRFSFRKESK